MAKNLFIMFRFFICLCICCIPFLSNAQLVSSVRLNVFSLDKPFDFLPPKDFAYRVYWASDVALGFDVSEEHEVRLRIGRLYHNAGESDYSNYEIQGGLFAIAALKRIEKKLITWNLGFELVGKYVSTSGESLCNHCFPGFTADIRGEKSAISLGPIANMRISIWQKIFVSLEASIRAEYYWFNDLQNIPSPFDAGINNYNSYGITEKNKGVNFLFIPLAALSIGYSFS